MSEIINLQELLDGVFDKLDLPKDNPVEFFEKIKEAIFECLDKDKSVEIKYLGLFEIVSRKSGSPKLIFTPSEEFKERINKPFEHLKAIEIGTDEMQVPLTKLSQQADEIKDILTDIQGVKQVKQPIEQAPVIEEVKIEELPKVEDPQKIETPSKVVETAETVETPKVVATPEIEKQHLTQLTVEVPKKIETPPKVVETAETVETPKVVATPEIEKQHPPQLTEKSEQSKQASEFFSRKLETPPEIKANTFDYIPPDNYRRRKSRWGLWLLIVLLLAGGGFAAYYYYEPIEEFCRLVFDKNTASVDDDENIAAVDAAENFALPTDTMQAVENDSVKPEISSVEKPAADTTSIFDKERKYTEFIVEERLEQGNTLIKMARKYYGKGEFWIYIYEANRERIANPDNVSAGTLIKVPKLDAKLIDNQSVEAIDYANKLKQKYLNK